MHLQLPHAIIEVLGNLSESARRHCPQTIFGQVVSKCGRYLRRNVARRPIVRTRIPTGRVDTVGVAIIYPDEGSGRSRPYFITVRHLIRYTALARMVGREPEHSVDLRPRIRAHRLEKPTCIIYDKDHAFVGASWEVVGDLKKRNRSTLPRSDRLGKARREDR